ncbi:MAG: FHA domain-containing protein [Deltaproteobacteria bacterium]|nr:MAG: FHA domain-containing protein [Deltaproteobacteria bacterium]
MSPRKRITDVVDKSEPPFGSPYVLAIAVVDGPDRHAIHRITKPETVVGASEDADFMVDDPHISGKHFKVRVNGHLYSLIDLGSTNGTRLNKNLLSANSPVRLKNFDEIEAGHTRFLFIANRFRTD